MKELIKKYKLSYTLEDVSAPSWSKGNHFHYIIDVDGEEFDYWTSIADYEDGKDELSDKDLLLAFREIVDDALYPTQYDQDEFLRSFGFDESLESVRRGEEVYRGCQESADKLNLSESELIDILDELEERDVC